MGLETGTFISDLVVTNPPSGDPTAQGDDHIRLIKTALKNTFPQASKAIYFPTATVKSANFTLLVTDQYTTFLVDTTAGIVTATLPTLAAGDAGWECSFIKTNTGLNPLLIKPPSGTIQSGDLSGLTQTRRCIPGARSKVFWTGSNWYAERAINAPVGAVLTFDGASLPVGFEWPNGQTLASASTNYPDYNSRKGSGVTRDLRGRIDAGKDDMGGSAAGRLTTAGSGVDGLTLGAAGGSQNVAIALANLPAATLTTTIVDPGHGHLINGAASVNVGTPAGASSFASGSPQCSTLNISITPNTTGITASTALGGSGTATNVTQPTAVMNKILVVE